MNKEGFRHDLDVGETGRLQIGLHLLPKVLRMLRLSLTVGGLTVVLLGIVLPGILAIALGERGSGESKKEPDCECGIRMLFSFWCYLFCPCLSNRVPFIMFLRNFARGQ